MVTEKERFFCTSLHNLKCTIFKTAIFKVGLDPSSRNGSEARSHLSISLCSGDVFEPCQTV